MKILIVEDDTDTRYMYTIVLTDLGHEVIECNDGFEALKHLGSVDVILSDLNMPNMGGDELFQMTRNSDIGCPFILSTGKDGFNLDGAI